MTDLIKWTLIKVKLGDLKPNPENPKISTQSNIDKLEDSLETLGQFDTIIVDYDGVSAIDGNQRISAWLKKYGPELVLDARKPSRPLTKEEITKLIFYSGKGTRGIWDNDKLSQYFNVDELSNYGGFTNLELDAVFAVEVADSLTSESQAPPPPLPQPHPLDKLQDIVPENFHTEVEEKSDDKFLTTEYIPLESAKGKDGSRSKRVPYINIDGRKVHITERDAEIITRSLDNYLSINGITYGWAEQCVRIIEESE